MCVIKNALENIYWIKWKYDAIYDVKITHIKKARTYIIVKTYIGRNVIIIIIIISKSVKPEGWWKKKKLINVRKFLYFLINSPFFDLWHTGLLCKFKQLEGPGENKIIGPKQWSASDTYISPFVVHVGWYTD